MEHLYLMWNSFLGWAGLLGRWQLVKVIKHTKGLCCFGAKFLQIHSEMEWVDLDMGESSASSYLANLTSPIPSHCIVIILFKSVPVHQLSWLSLWEVVNSHLCLVCWCFSLYLTTPYHSVMPFSSFVRNTWIRSSTTLTMLPHGCLYLSKLPLRVSNFRSKSVRALCSRENFWKQ